MLVEDIKTYYYIQIILNKYQYVCICELVLVKKFRMEEGDGLLLVTTKVIRQHNHSLPCFNHM